MRGASRYNLSMTRPKGTEGYVAQEPEAEALSRREATSHPQSHQQNEVLEQLPHALTAM